MTDAELHEALAALLPAQFEALLLHADVPAQYLSPASAPLATRAAELARWVGRAAERRARVTDALARVSASARPPDHGGADARDADDDRSGPLFIAHASHGEGPALAREVAWTLRTWGLPVWHDETDALTTDLKRGLETVLDGPLAGGVLVVTPDLEHAAATRVVEVPRLAARAARAAGFTWLVATSIADAAGRADAAATDRLLERDTGLWSDVSLRRQPHFLARTPAGRDDLARAAALQRMRAWRDSGARELPIDLRTRDLGGVERGAGLLVRCRPPAPDSDTPPDDMWPSYAAFLAELPRLVKESGARGVRISGRAHLSAAFALGAALPEPALGALRVCEESGAVWEGEAVIELAEETRAVVGTGDAVAVWVDLLERDATPLFDAYLCARRDVFGSSTRLGLRVRKRLTPAEGATLVRAIAARLHARLAQAGTSQPLHLFLAVPFPAAVLLGRLSNRLHVQLYELQRLPAPHYVPSVRCLAGQRAPIVALPPVT